MLDNPEKNSKKDQGIFEAMLSIQKSIAIT